jgi:SAM-dependent methyltransferase
MNDARDLDMHFTHGGTVSAERAYGALAPRFDELQRQNAVLAHSARASLRLVTRAMAGTRVVLDIGCGTGREALILAAAGKTVVACDPSTELLEVLNRKAGENGLTGRIRTFPFAASRLGKLGVEVGPHSFDGAYASFSLSYEPTLAGLPETIWNLLRPGAPFLCSLYNRLCLTEILLGAPFLVPRRALRRLEGATRIPVDRYHVVVQSSTPAEVRRTFEGYFALEGTWAIPAIVPPNYLDRLLQLAAPLRQRWEDLDLRLNGKWPFRHLGSHTAYLFRARP